MSDFVHALIEEREAVNDAYHKADAEAVFHHSEHYRYSRQRKEASDRLKAIRLLLDSYGHKDTEPLVPDSLDVSA